MITKTTNLDSSYTSLWAEIKKASGGLIDINSLEQYFGNIQEIAGVDIKFLRLPLDEPMFEIDANTRKIDTSKFNGVQVQGDNSAEIIFFCIDRYFDHTDLNNMNIYINWKMGNVSKRSENFIKSADIIPGKIVFGWAISKDLTEKNGQLSFAVEFYGDNYSLNTLPASLNIKEGLVLVDPAIVNVSEDILSRLQNSAFGEGDAAVEDVVWVTGNGNGLVALGEDGTPVSNYVGIFNLNTGINGEGVPQSVPATFVAEGFAGSDAEIFYSAPEGVDFSTDYIAVAPKASEEDVLAEGKNYYFMDGENYAVAGEEELLGWADMEAPIQLFEKVGKLVVSEAGTYIINAQGAKYDTEGRKIGGGEIVSSGSIVVPEAEKPVEVKVEGESDAEELEEGSDYTVAEGLENTIFIGEDGNAILSAAPIFADGTTVGALSFDWYKENVNGSIKESGYAITAEDELTLPVMINEEEVSEGKYYVKVKHFKNGTEAEEVASALYTVSHFASGLEENENGEPIIAIETPSNSSVFDSNIPVEFKPGFSIKITATPSFVDEARVGNLAYKWQKTNSVVDDAGVPLENIAWEDVATLSTNSIQLGEEGFYRLVICNNYNGSIYCKASKFFHVNEKRA